MFRAIGLLAGAALIIGLAVGGYVYRDRWLPSSSAPVAESTESGHEGHDHGSEGETNFVTLSPQARQNLGLKVGTVELSDCWRTISVPGAVVERPGHNHRKVTAPLTGIISEVFIHPNQLIRPGQPLAELELTGEQLAAAQGSLLATLRDLEVNRQELDRVNPLVKSGALPEKNKLQLEYERKKLESQREAQSQALQVLGLSSEQVDKIESTRMLLRRFQVPVPAFSTEEKSHAADSPAARAGLISTAKNVDSKSPTPSAERPGTDWSYTVEQLDVYAGKRVQIGDELCSLAFHETLYVEGRAFEKEGELVARALKQRWPIKATFEMGDDQGVVRDKLTILFLDNVVDPATRTFRFFLALSNEVLHDSVGPKGEVYRSWRFKPGQKVRLEVPVALMKDCIMLPADAVVREGPDAFVFRANGSKLERQAVHVLYLSGGSVNLANDGSLFPGDVVALNSAYQLNLALKKASGEGADPHAGHSHAH